MKLNNNLSSVLLASLVFISATNVSAKDTPAAVPENSEELDNSNDLVQEEPIVERQIISFSKFSYSLDGSWDAIRGVPKLNDSIKKTYDLTAKKANISANVGLHYGLVSADKFGLTVGLAIGIATSPEYKFEQKLTDQEKKLKKDARTFKVKTEEVNSILAVGLQANGLVRLNDSWIINLTLGLSQKGGLGKKSRLVGQFVGAHLGIGRVVSAIKTIFSLGIGADFKIAELWTKDEYKIQDPFKLEPSTDPDQKELLITTNDLLASYKVGIVLKAHFLPSGFAVAQED